MGINLLLGMTICYLFMSLMIPPIIIDSMIYKVDVDNFTIKELRLNENAIDYMIDDFLYLFTDRYLYKIDVEDLTLIDYIPLPVRFNYMITRDKNIVLIATDEVIILDKNNLTFKAGIGIERGDYRPIRPSRYKNFVKNHFLYLISDAGEKSYIRIFDLNTGRLFKTLNVDRVIGFDYNPQNNTLTSLDRKNNLTIYDMYLNKKKKINLKMQAESFKNYDEGYIIYNGEGIFYLNMKGTMIDFQPVANDDHTKFIFINKNDMIFIDSLTSRVKYTQKNYFKLQIVFENEYLNYAIGIDADNDFYIIDSESFFVKPLLEKEISLRKALPKIITTDSLWYLQLGAFSNHENAWNMYKNIRENGFPVFIDTVDLYRIKLGGFEDKIIAFEFVEKSGLDGWFVFEKKIEKKEAAELYVNHHKYIFENGIIRKE